jgi:colicin import membrane protein
MKSGGIAGATLVCMFALPLHAEDRPSATGAAETASAASSAVKPLSADYSHRLAAAIKVNITFMEETPQPTPVAEVTLVVAPDGTIRNAALTKPSSFAPWNEAVMRAIAKTQRLPLDVDGRIPSRIQLSFSAR